MAHLTINPRTSFNKLVSMLEDYHREMDAATDPFARLEIRGFIGTIEDFCVTRGGMEYLDRVRVAAGRR